MSIVLRKILNNLYNKQTTSICKEDINMFSRAKGGWVDINIGGYTINGSYLTDIPMDFLDSLIF